jgi:hypothetical protein
MFTVLKLRVTAANRIKNTLYLLSVRVGNHEIVKTCKVY